MFSAPEGWRVRFEMPQPKEIRRNISDYKISLIVPKAEMMNIYWDIQNGSIKVISPGLETGLEEYQVLEVGFDEAKEILENGTEDYYVTFIKDNLKIPVLKKRPAIGYIKAKEEGPYRLSFNPLTKFLEIEILSDIEESVILFVTRAGDPTHLIERLVIEPEVSGWKDMIKIKTDFREISIYRQEADEEDEYIPVSYEMAREKGIFEIRRNYPDPEILIHWTKSKDFVAVTIGGVEDNSNFIGDDIRTISYHGHLKISLFVTRRGDPFYLIGLIEVAIGDLMVADNRTVYFPLESDEDISIYTDPIFKTYSLTIEE